MPDPIAVANAVAAGVLLGGFYAAVTAVGHIADDIPEMQRDAGNRAADLHCLALDLRQPQACDQAIE